MGNLGILAVEGTDAATFLQGYVTADLDLVESSQAMPMAVTDIKGRVLANGWAYGDSERVHLVMHSSLLSGTEQHLGRYMIFSRSRVRQLDQAMDLSAISSTDGIVLQPLQWRLRAQDSKSSNWPALTIDEQLPLVTHETSGMFLPQMLGLTEHGVVNFTKGCYLGQEVIARAQHRGAVKRRIQRYKIKNGKLQLAERLSAENGSNGVVVACSASHALVVVNGAPQNLTSENGADLVLTPS